MNESTAESMLRTQFKMELIVYTQDITYSSSLRKRKREEEELEEGELVKNPSLSFGSQKVLSVFSVRSTVNGHDNHAALREMMLHLKSYYNVSQEYLQ